MSKNQMAPGNERWLLARSWYAAGRNAEFVCPLCQGTYATIENQCSAPLDKTCPGFEVTENAYIEFEKNWKALTGQE